ncbi:hypothetical protein ACM5SU_004525 [Salmonella enterica subsp. enterica serovar Agona]
MHRLIDKMAANPETHYCPADRRYRVVLDPAEACPDDPGNRTVAMVYGPREACATVCVDVQCRRIAEDAGDGFNKQDKQRSGQASPEARLAL